MKLTQLAGIQRGFTQRMLTEADLLNGWSVGIVKTLTLTRTDNIVVLEIPAYSLTGKSKTGNDFLSLPPGFRIATTGNYGSVGFLQGTAGPIQVGKNFNLLNCSATSDANGILMWRTTDSFPPPAP